MEPAKPVRQETAPAESKRADSPSNETRQKQKPQQKPREEKQQERVHRGPVPHDQLPAFLLRPVTFPKSKVTDDSDAETVG